MKKYLQVFKITFKEYFVYRLNFLLWRVRNVAQLLVLYFLWQAAIPEGQTVFGYDQTKMLTYILGVSIIRSFVLASRSVEVASDIATGDLSNFLLKPLGYFRYWFTRDIADKILNFSLAVIEITLVIFILHPPLVFQKSLHLLFLTLLAVGVGTILYFYFSLLLAMIAFWSPENSWSPRFLFLIVLEFFAGGLFPLDILPGLVFRSLSFLPFPYLLFFPLNVYLGKLTSGEILFGLSVGLVWVFLFYRAVKFTFQLGLKNYTAWGR